MMSIVKQTGPSKSECGPANPRHGNTGLYEFAGFLECRIGPGFRPDFCTRQEQHSAF
jgi:hypothetical protein